MVKVRSLKICFLEVFRGALTFLRAVVDHVQDMIRFMVGMVPFQEVQALVEFIGQAYRIDEKDRQAQAPVVDCLCAVRDLVVDIPDREDRSVGLR